MSVQLLPLRQQLLVLLVLLGLVLLQRLRLQHAAASTRQQLLLAYPQQLHW